MRKNSLLFVLFILGILYVPYSYSQNIKKESFVSIYIANDFSRTMYQPIFTEDNNTEYIENQGFTPVFGFDIRLSEGVHGSLRAGGYSISDTFNDIYSNTSIRNYMIGLKVKNPEHPFFINFFTGLNTIDYNLEDVDDDLLPTNKSFALGGNAGLRIFRTKRLSYDLSIGYNKSFDKELSNSKIYFQVSLPFIVVYK